MFLEKRVYQGSSGKVYPLPMTDRIDTRSKTVAWDAIHLENEYLYVMILPQLGGRIHVLRDKTNGYDAIYNQPVIKPALVGLAGPWASGGIEFNWPQHHRPSTFMPTDVEIERHADGSVTAWLGEHDPMARMKGMHGVCLHPGRAVMELKVRAYNRTPLVQTFLWWANTATCVHEGYQSFFPPDTRCVADHAKRAMSEYPLCRGRYYGVDYGRRAKKGLSPAEIPSQFVPAPYGASDPKIPAHALNDLSWYANIPAPTSYMCLGTEEDFLGGYDYKAGAGLMLVADHHIAPGKKQWTWGNQDFGYAWDRNLTEPDAAGEYPPYIELMSGVFTDNQPDFSFLQPGETKTWSQFWYPFQKIGPAQHANPDAAAALRVEGGRIRFGVSVTREFAGARVVLEYRGRTLFEGRTDLAPDKPFTGPELEAPKGLKEPFLKLEISDRDGREIIGYAPKARAAAPLPDAAEEPPQPVEIGGTDELFITGLHLEQYRHATRCPTLYWKEALRRDPGNARCNNAMGLWHLRRGEFSTAEDHFRRAVERLTLRNPNPYDGEPFYNLGLSLRYQGRDGEAYDAFYKAVWNQAWQAAGYHALAEIDCARKDWARALDHADRSLRLNADNLRSRNLKALVLRRLGRADEASRVLRETLRLDLLDWWARHLADETLSCDSQVRLDLAHDCARAGLEDEAVRLLREAMPEPGSGTGPMLAYTLAWISQRLNDPKTAARERRKARRATPDYCFPSRLEDIAVLETAMAADPKDARAPYYLGNLFYDRRRHREAIRLWEKAVRLEPGNAVAWRNLGIGYCNVLKAPAKARAAYEKAFHANPGDARLLFERDQLWKRLGETPAKRLRELERHPRLVRERDDLSIELCALYNRTAQPEKALPILSTRIFQPWEGGEGLALGQHVLTHLSLGRKCLERGDARDALSHFQQALAVPDNLGEGRHPLANAGDIHYWLGCAHAASDGMVAARRHWKAAAAFEGDFQNMRVQRFSEMTYYAALSRERLGQKAQAEKLLRELLAYARKLEKTPARIDYFATSLPTLLLFDEDLQARQSIQARFMQAQALHGLGRRKQAARLLADILREDPNHALAGDFVVEP